MRYVFVMLVAASLGGCATPGPRVEDASFADRILALEKTRLEAFRDNDQQVFASLISEDLTMVHSNGSVGGKNQEIAIMRPATADRPLPQLQIEDTLVRKYGDAAILVGNLVEREQDGKVSLKLRFTNVYGLREGQWKLVAGQLTRAPTE